MKKTFVIGPILALAASINTGCATSLDTGRGNSAYTLSLVGANKQFLTVRLKNNSNHELISHGLFLMPGKGSAGLFLSIIDKNGREHPLCAMVDQADPGEGRIQAHGVLEQKFYFSWLKEIYCLKSGRYTVQGTFAVPRPSASPQIVAESAPISLTIK